MKCHHVKQIDLPRIPPNTQSNVGPRIIQIKTWARAQKKVGVIAIKIYNFIVQLHIFTILVNRVCIYMV